MAVDSRGTSGEPIFLASGAEDSAADLTELGAYALQRGGLMRGTTAERGTFTSAGYPSEGDHWYDTTLDIEYVWSGTAWVALTATPRTYTPSLSGITDGALTAKWSMAGGLVTVSAQLTANKLWSAYTGPVVVGIPTGTIQSDIGTLLGDGMIVDVSAGELYSAAVRRNTSNTVTVEWVDVSGTGARLRAIPGTLGITATNGVTMSLQFCYYPGV